jgi:hypothetical protein
VSDRFPIQPLYKDEGGVLRFKPNRIVRALLDSSVLDMSKLAMMDFTNEERGQFAQLIGYSLSGFAELSYVSDETYETAAAMTGGVNSEIEARVAYLEERLEATRTALKELVPKLFRIHPDDLTV